MIESEPKACSKRHAQIFRGAISGYAKILGVPPELPGAFSVILSARRIITSARQGPQQAKMNYPQYSQKIPSTFLSPPEQLLKYSADQHSRIQARRNSAEWDFHCAGFFLAASLCLLPTF